MNQATWIRQLRADLGLSQAQFAQLLGVHAMTASRWERGTLAPTAFQKGLMIEFRKSADQRHRRGSHEDLGTLLASSGTPGVLYLLLKTARE